MFTEIIFTAGFMTTMQAVPSVLAAMLTDKSASIKFVTTMRADHKKLPVTLFAQKLLEFP
jgi:hypothetical protein